MEYKDTKMDRIKVLYVSHTSSMHGSGIALLNILKELEPYAIDPIVVLPKYGTFCIELNKLGIEYKYVSLYPQIYPRLKLLRDFILFFPRLSRLIFNNVRSRIQLGKIIKEITPDIIHTNTGVIHVAHFVAKKYKIPHVWHIREYQDLHFGWTPFPSKRNFLTLLQHKNNQIITITKDIFNHHQLNESNACVIYDGVIKYGGIPEIIYEKEKYFLFVGRLEKGKGIEDVIQAFGKIAKQYPAHKFLIAGDGASEYTIYLNNMVSDMTLTRQIIFLGFRTDIYDLMSKALGLIVASRSEGFGFITVEAMFNGCLVIGKNTGGTKEQFDNGLMLTGEEIALRYETEEDLIGCMCCILDNGTHKYSQMISQAQETVNKLYSTKNNVEKVYKLYRTILEKNE